jgi:hypothetical protein
MNHLLLGAADKTSQLLAWAEKTFLLIDDGPVADHFLERFPHAKLFDVVSHTFNPLRGIDYKRARDFAQTVYTASPEGRDTLTVRNGRRALTKLLLASKRLDKLPRQNETDPAVAEALNSIDDILLSPVLHRVLCNPSNFSFKGMVVARLNRASVGDFDAFLLASLLMGQVEGQLIVPDFGFYGRDYHTSLIRQDRLTAGIHFLAELPARLRNEALLIQDKIGHHCTPKDAAILADHAGLIPGTTAHTDFLQNRVT